MGKQKELAGKSVEAAKNAKQLAIQGAKAAKMKAKLDASANKENAGKKKEMDKLTQREVFEKKAGELAAKKDKEIGEKKMEAMKYKLVNAAKKKLADLKQKAANKIERQQKDAVVLSTRREKIKGEEAKGGRGRIPGNDE